MNDRRTFLGTLLGWLGLGGTAKASQPVPKPEKRLFGHLAFPETVVAHVPKFRRYLKCGCGMEMPLYYVASYPMIMEWEEDCFFHGFCTQCKQTVAWEMEDRPLTDDAYRRYDSRKFDMDGYEYPRHETMTVFDTVAGTCDCVWYVPEILLHLIRKGDRYVLAGVPLEIIAMVRKDGRACLKLNPDVHTMGGKPLAEGLADLLEKIKKEEA